MYRKTIGDANAWPFHRAYVPSEYQSAGLAAAKTSEASRTCDSVGAPSRHTVF